MEPQQATQIDQRKGGIWTRGRACSTVTDMSRRLSGGLGLAGFEQAGPFEPRKTSMILTFSKSQLG
jgi:hypothetical protein